LCCEWSIGQEMNEMPVNRQSKEACLGKAGKYKLIQVNYCAIFMQVSSGCLVVCGK
jgi:hypothetical protein